MTSPDPIRAALEEAAKVADGMARIGRQLKADNDEYAKRTGKNSEGANAFCDHRIKVAEEIAAAIRALSPGAAEPVAWRCFHCGTVCKTEQDALEHFGQTMDHLTACQGNGGQPGQRLRHHVKSLLNGIDTKLVRIETDADETLARDMKFIRWAVDAFTADPLRVVAPQPVAWTDKYPRIWCRQCEETRECRVDEMPADSLNDHGAMDLLCKDCNFVIATVHAAPPSFENIDQVQK